jgi:[acyl-carrier-protein] S-malonyltransferase
MVDHTKLPFRDDVVALFPGQGSISAAAGTAWRSSTHWDIVTRVSEVAHVDVEALLLDENGDDVVRTDRAQLATFALSLVGYYELLDLGVRPRYLLGHSLGEFSALVASGLLALDEGTRLIAVRGAAMARAADLTEGSMVAVMGGDEGARSALAALDDVWIANINGTGQIVVSGTRGGLDNLMATHRELGWRRATPLPVGGAFHSPLMAPAQDELDVALDNTAWGFTLTRKCTAHPTSGANSYVDS